MLLGRSGRSARTLCLTSLYLLIVEEVDDDDDGDGDDDDETASDKKR